MWLRVIHPGKKLACNNNSLNKALYNSCEWITKGALQHKQSQWVNLTILGTPKYRKLLGSSCNTSGLTKTLRASVRECTSKSWKNFMLFTRRWLPDRCSAVTYMLWVRYLSAQVVQTNSSQPSACVPSTFHIARRSSITLAMFKLGFHW